MVNPVILQGIINLKGVQSRSHNLNLQRVSQLLTKQLGKVGGIKRLASRLLPRRVRKISLPTLRMKTLPMPILILILINCQKTNNKPINSTPSGLIK